MSYANRRLASRKLIASKPGQQPTLVPTHPGAISIVIGMIIAEVNCEKHATYDDVKASLCEILRIILCDRDESKTYI